MNWGRTLTAALAVISCAFVLAACGSKGASQSSTEAFAAKADAGATGATGDAAEESGSKNGKSNSNSKSSDGSSSKSGSGSSSTQKKAKDGRKDDSDKAQSNANTPPGAVHVKPLSSTVKQDVDAAFTKMISAFDKHDVTYLCGQAFSKGFISTVTEPSGGCTAYSNKFLATVKSYAATVKDIGPVPDSELVQVYASLKPVTDKGQQQVDASIYFEKEDGTWKRAAPPKA